MKYATASHRWIRVVAIANCTLLFLSLVSPPVSRWLANGPLAPLILVWMPLSSILLLVGVLVEVVLLHKAKDRHAGLVIDATLTVAWLIFFFSAVGYMLFNRAAL